MHRPATKRLRIAVTVALCTASPLACTADAPDEAAPAVPDEAAPAASGDQAARHDWLIVPGRRIGPVTPETGADRLQEAVGPGNIRPATAHFAEASCAYGSVLYGGTPDELVVLWQDSTRSVLAAVRVSEPESRWHTPAGVRVGSTLSELEAIAGEPLTFYGFGWDGSGMGRWTEDLGGARDTMYFRLYPDAESIQSHGDDPAFSELIGSVELRSDHPLIRQMTVRVEELGMGWRRPQEFDCPEAEDTEIV